jgi:hypothetical protein
MFMTLCYPTGRRVEGVLLATGRDRLRLAVRGRNETIELHVEEGRWVSDEGVQVELESVIWNGETAIPQQFEEAPRTFSAGG